MTDIARAALPIDLGSGPFAVTTQGLAKRFGSVRALDGLDLQVPEGAVYVLVGPNGAGKSTLIRTLMGLVRYQAGAVSVLGRDPADRGAEVRADIGYVPEDYRFGYAWMTVGRWLEHQAVYHPSWDNPVRSRAGEEVRDRSRPEVPHAVEGPEPTRTTPCGAGAQAAAAPAGRADRRPGSRGAGRDAEHPERTPRRFPHHGSDLHASGLRSGAPGGSRGRAVGRAAPGTIPAR